MARPAPKIKPLFHPHKPPQWQQCGRSACSRPVFGSREPGQTLRTQEHGRGMHHQVMPSTLQTRNVPTLASPSAPQLDDASLPGAVDAGYPHPHRRPDCTYGDTATRSDANSQAQCKLTQAGCRPMACGPAVASGASPGALSGACTAWMCLDCFRHVLAGGRERTARGAGAAHGGAARCAAHTTPAAAAAGPLTAACAVARAA